MKLNGPGKYDTECTAAHEGTQAQAVMLVVLNGYRGSGISVKFTEAHLMPYLADVLEAAAIQIRRDVVEGGTS